MARFHWATRTVDVLSHEAWELLWEERRPGLEQGYDVIDLDVTDYGADGVRVQRLERILQSYRELYKSFLTGLGSDPENADLEVHYLDSGTSLNIVLKWWGEAIAASKDALIEIWDRIRFREHYQFDRQIDTLTEGLDALERIEDNDSLSDEARADCMRTIESKLQELVGNGAVPHEALGEEEDRQQLLTSVRDRPLLTGGGDDEDGEEDGQE